MKELVFHRWFLPWVERAPHAPFVVDVGDGHRASLGTHADRVLRLGSALHDELGLAPGDRFAVLASNSHRFLELYHAGLLGAGVVNPLNVRYAPPELVHVLRDSATRVVFTDAHFAATVHRIRDEADLATVVLLGDGDVPHDLSYEDLVASGDAREPDEPDEDDPAILMYTGGTTGLPKGVLCSQRAEVLNAMHLRLEAPVTGMRSLVQSPMFHAAAIAFVMCAHTLDAPLSIIPAFDPEHVLRVIEDHHIEFTTMVPTMVGLLLDHPAFRAESLTSLRVLAYGASPMPVGLVRRLQEVVPGIDLIQGYGMTEASSLVTTLTPEDHRRGGEILRSVGRPVPGVRVSIRDPEARPLARGQVGEVCVQGGNLMDGYWHQPDATEEALRGGWYHSGDAGYVDADGYLFLVDRVKDMIVSGGENVYSAEVEHAIGTHPAVAQVAVIGIPDATWGEAVHAIVVRKPGHTVTEDEIVAYARRSIAGYKVPKSVVLRAEPLPLSGALKVLKRELRAPYWVGQERDIS